MDQLLEQRMSLNESISLFDRWHKLHHKATKKKWKKKFHLKARKIMSFWVRKWLKMFGYYFGKKKNILFSRIWIRLVRRRIIFINLKTVKIKYHIPILFSKKKKDVRERKKKYSRMWLSFISSRWALSSSQNIHTSKMITTTIIKMRISFPPFPKDSLIFMVAIKAIEEYTRIIYS